MKIVVAYSGGLDTSVLLLWLKEKYNAEIYNAYDDIDSNNVHKLSHHEIGNR